MAGEWFRRTPARENIEANDREEAGQVRTEDESIEGELPDISHLKQRTKVISSI